MINVLIATATYADKMRKETIDSVQAQVFDGVWQWRQYRENPFPYGDRRNYFAQYDAIRTDMLNGDFDAILFVEHDMEVPPDALQKLWDTGDQVAYGVYLLRHGIEILNTYRWVSNQGIGESLSLYAQQLEAARAQVVAEVSGMASGARWFAVRRWNAYRFAPTKAVARQICRSRLIASRRESSR